MQNWFYKTKKWTDGKSVFGTLKCHYIHSTTSIYTWYVSAGFVKCYSKYTFSLFQAHSLMTASMHWFHLLLFCHICTIDSKTCDPHILNSLGIKRKKRNEWNQLERRFPIWNAIGMGNWINSENAMQRILRYRRCRCSCCFYGTIL